MPTLWIPGRIPGFNEILEAKATRGRRGKRGQRYNLYAGMKRTWSERIALCARAAGFPPVLTGGLFSYEFREPNKKRDPSNVVSGGVKIIEDALQDAGLLRNDGWEHVRGITVTWRVDPIPGVLVTITPLALAPEMGTLSAQEDADRGHPQRTKAPARGAPRARSPKRPRCA